jgi:hypothetical protein
MSPLVAGYSRDALAKACYSRLFDFLVTRVNDGLAMQQSAIANFIGVLDIYGKREICARSHHHLFGSSKSLEWMLSDRL